MPVLYHCPHLVISPGSGLIFSDKSKTSYYKLKLLVEWVWALFASCRGPADVVTLMWQTIRGGGASVGSRCIWFSNICGFVSIEVVVKNSVLLYGSSNFKYNKCNALKFPAPNWCHELPKLLNMNWNWVVTHTYVLGWLQKRIKKEIFGVI